jgi:hypothetical protein
VRGRTHRRPDERFPAMPGRRLVPELALRAPGRTSPRCRGSRGKPATRERQSGLDAALGTDQDRRLVVVHGLRRYPLRLPLPSGPIGHGREHPVRLFMRRPTERPKARRRNGRLLDCQVLVFLEQPAKPTEQRTATAALCPPTGSATRRTRRSGRPTSPHPAQKCAKIQKPGAGLRPRGIASPAAEVVPTRPRCPGQTPTCTDAGRAEYSRPAFLTSPARGAREDETPGAGPVLAREGERPRWFPTRPRCWATMAASCLSTLGGPSHEEVYGMLAAMPKERLGSGRVTARSVLTAPASRGKRSSGRRSVRPPRRAH